MALLDREPVAYRWAALREGPHRANCCSGSPYPGDAYLWDFETLRRWRGRGVYPHLLQGILSLLGSIDRFWIGYEEANAASARGIEKAGFGIVGDLEISEGRGHRPRRWCVTMTARRRPASCCLPSRPATR